MKTVRFMADGFSAVLRNKRLVIFAWLVNLAFGMVLAVPMMNLIGRSVADTQREELLLQRTDENWWQTFRYEQRDNEIVRMLDYSIFGAGPFMQFGDRLLSGGVVNSVGGFLVGAVTTLRLNFSGLSLLTLVTLVYAAVGSLMAGGFVNAYWSGYPVTIAEFISDGGRFFGRFIRLAIIGLLVSALLFHYVGDWAQYAIARWTANEPSEMTPFIFYLIKNAVMAFLVAVVVLSLDYAKIMLVADDRVSAIAAFGAGVIFTVGRFGRTFPLFFVLWLIGLALMALYGVVEGMFAQATWWSIMGVFVLQQVYMILRLTLKAGFYGSEIALYRQVEAERVRAVANA